MNSLISYFEQVPLFAILPEKTQKRLERIAEQRHYRRRQVIHFADQPGDYVYLLCTGRIKMSRVSDQGREVTLYLLEGTNIFGETGLFTDNQAYDLMAETIEDSLIAVFRRAEIMAAVEETPQAAIELLKLISERRAIAESSVADLVFLEVPRRLTKLLLRLNGSHKNGRAASPMKTKFTHQELANMIGSTRETTTLILNEFKRQGYLDFIGRKIIIHKPDDLEAILHRGV